MPIPVPAAKDFGHHFLIGLRPTVELDEADKRLLNALRPAGIVVFRANFHAAAQYPRWLEQFSSLVRQARDCIERDDLLICIDHEGGTVLRPPPPITPFGFPRQWAGRAGAVGEAMGTELASLGINVNFAPTLDVDTNPQNPIIGPRAFGRTVDEVVPAARAFLTSLHGQAVLGCVKHFPGHGDTRADSHYELPVVDADLTTIRTRELQPFKELAGEAHLVMTAHIVFPAVDDQFPATMSETFIRRILREDFGYRGVVVTDDIGMRAVSERYTHPHATVATIRAGCDLILIGSHWTSTDRALQLAEHIRDAALSGELSDRTLAESFARVKALLERAPRNSARRLDADVFAAHARLAPLRTQAGAGQTASLTDP